MFKIKDTQSVFPEKILFVQRQKILFKAYFNYIYVDKRQALEIQSFYLVTNALIIKIGRRTPNKGAHKKTCMILEDTHKKVFFLVVGRRTS